MKALVKIGRMTKDGRNSSLVHETKGIAAFVTEMSQLLQK